MESAKPESAGAAQISHHHARIRELPVQLGLEMRKVLHPISETISDEHDSLARCRLFGVNSDGSAQGDDQCQSLDGGQFGSAGEQSADFGVGILPVVAPGDRQVDLFDGHADFGRVVAGDRELFDGVEEGVAGAVELLLLRQ